MQAETCKILSWAENPRWSRVWQNRVSVKGNNWSLMFNRGGGNLPNLSILVCLAGLRFSHEPVNFVHRKWTFSYEVSQNLRKCDLFCSFCTWKVLLTLWFQQIKTFCYIFSSIKRQTYAKYHKKSGWHCLGSQEEKDALMPWTLWKSSCGW